MEQPLGANPGQLNPKGGGGGLGIQGGGGGAYAGYQN